MAGPKAAATSPKIPRSQQRFRNIPSTAPSAACFDVVLLGGPWAPLLTSAGIASPVIGALTLLSWLHGWHIASVALWVSASTFPSSAVVGRNVQLAIAIATDVSTEKERGHTLALVGLGEPIMSTALFSLGLLTERRGQRPRKRPSKGSGPQGLERPVLGYIGLLASLLQGGFSRRAKAGVVAKLACSAPPHFFSSQKQTARMLYLAATFLAVTSAALRSARRTGAGNGEFRSAVTILTIIHSSLYWWAGKDTAYVVGGVGMSL
ncbi:hypothetical protein FN846DRAFT_930144 [Sphaerosporella brunnea]|uniref:Uncharacterized protein n=1 Tax=Sphaerosporella brunnea TaxID=1250544 RepID=A0A5J5F8J9_9PEZI|nr:hypothetical protein FN846DRAFT_930144 [Sphaerosporella brunnea]